MDKVEIGVKPFLYPMPVTLVGANVEGKPNYLAVGYCGIMNHRPPIISVALNRRHFTNAGIKANGTFSVNLPSAEMVEITDFCGIVSGQKVDKADLFETFYGRLGTAPMIKECPLNLECRLIQMIDFGWDEAFIGEIVAAYSDESYLSEGIPDMRKLRPMVFSTEDNGYWAIGERLGQAFSVGKGFQPKRR